ncbi:MAG: hypothetical protein HJJLKODD_02500 [Phycisphaerae bacterium]|nr:hypothetical protein [Phycisphaerae bacterium]
MLTDEQLRELTRRKALRHRAQPIGQILARRLNPEKLARLAQARRQLEELLTDVVADYGPMRCWVESCDHGILTIATTDPLWADHLRRRSLFAIRSALSSSLPELSIHEIRFRVGTWP